MNKVFENIAKKHGSAVAEYRAVFAVPYYKDVAVVLDLIKAGINYSKFKSDDFETIYFVLED